MIEKLPPRRNGCDEIDRLQDRAKINQIIDTLNTLMEKKDCKCTEFPQIGDKYWYIWGSGDVVMDVWDNGTFDNSRKNFMGVYKTEAAAREVVDKVKELLLGLKK